MPNRRPFGRNLLSSFFMGCMVVVAAVALYASFGQQKPVLLEFMDQRLSDAMFRSRGGVAPGQPIVIVDLDEKSLRQIGQWPWPRHIVAQLIRTIGSAAPKAIGMDIVFAEPDRTSPGHLIDTIAPLLPTALPLETLAAIKNDQALNHDVILGNAMAATPSVLGYVFQTRNDGLKDEAAQPFPSATVRLSPDKSSLERLTLPSAYRAILNVAEIAQGKSEGFFNVSPDAAGTVRRVPLFMTLDNVPYPSLALEMARLGLGRQDLTIHVAPSSGNTQHTILGVSLGDRFIPTDEQGQIAINYRGPARTYPYVSALDVLEGRGLDRLRDQYVLIGTSAAGLLDLKATPFSSSYPGVEVHANIIDNILSTDPLTHDIFTEIGINVSLIVIGGLLLVMLLTRARPLVGGVVGLIMLTAMVYGNYLFFFSHQRIVGITYPLLSLAAVFVGVTLFNYFFEGREKRFISAAFGHYVSPQIVHQLTEHPERLSLRGEQKDLTVLFSDIRGFTSISEKMSADELGRFMNEYLTAMSSVIMEHQGTVDKYIGDAIMAIWGAPLDDPEHAKNCLRSAFGMIAKLEDLNTEWQARGLPAITIGLGVNTGVMSVGNFGSTQRFDYTVMGDNVNLASRLESSNKTYGTRIVISEFTRNAIGKDFFCRYLDQVRVKGKNMPVKIYEPVCEGTPPADLQEQEDAFLEALDLYLDRKFEEAELRFRDLHEKHPRPLHDLYLERLNHFRQTPPPSDWDGSFTMTSK